MSRILLLEDDEALGRGICMALETPNCTVTHCSTRLQAIKILQGVVFDLLILDINLPDGSGLELLRTLRQNGTSTPAILLTANDLELDEVTGLEAGADDYITKPFSNAVLLAHVEAILRRSGVGVGKGENKEYGLLRVDSENKRVFLHDKDICLTAKEYTLLMYFLDNINVVVLRENIINQVWGYNYVGDTRTVDTHIKQLRSKLTSECSYIKTVHGFGYKFVVEENEINN